MKTLKLLRAVVLSYLLLTVLGFGHLNVASYDMMPMNGMTHKMTSSIQCQVLCTSTTKSEEIRFIGIEQKDDDQSPLLVAGLTTVLGLFTIGFIVKRLHLLSSWRPPDLVLLSGRYSDGL